MTENVSQNPPPAARLYVTAALAAGAVLQLDADQAHYLRNVLRLEPGATLALFNGRDGQWSGNVAALGKRGGEVVLRHQTRPQLPEPDLWLAFAPVKKARIDFIAR